MGSRSRLEEMLELSNKERVRCMRCLSRGMFVTRRKVLDEYLDKSYDYEYECTDCGETMDLKWEYY